MNWITYNPDETTDGFECRYKIEDKTLFVLSYGANSFWDWMYCIFGAFLKPKKVYNGKYEEQVYSFHRKWYYWAFRFFRNIRKHDFNKIKFRGHSMGGVVNDIIVFLLENYSQRILELPLFNLKYGSPKPCRKGYIPGINYFNRGDFIPCLPPWYKRNHREILNKKWRPVWVAHSQYKWQFEDNGEVSLTDE